VQPLSKEKENGKSNLMRFIGGVGTVRSVTSASVHALIQTCRRFNNAML